VLLEENARDKLAIAFKPDAVVFEKLFLADTIRYEAHHALRLIPNDAFH
jgi:hypothetical protein